MNESVPDVTSLFRQKLRMDLSIDDCDARIFHYYEEINGISPVLKAQITRLIDLERPDSKSADVALFDLILEHAKVQQRFHRISETCVAKSETKLGKSDRKPQRATSDKQTVPRPAPPPVATPPATRGASAAQSLRSSPRDGYRMCKGAHWFKKCPLFTDAQREEATKRFREAKE
ncbi:hypothetical protein PC129_g20711 [Phytophthora cactorum]|uniref:Uncharacterized protein n=1 Tax=Phytophthora cactorum TaxID=29920 RepID=A0A329ST14_9STRA|nr:hypothetical protein PC111_g554 [Phytophthora cactorum]KAG2933677.1 hypothetical protein PC114_g1364 [Phytophthora cactorum]KAG2954701.1 hypothetical protein PC117_g947 [Phytophthora cactorum]KAG2983517.1 hypothetical protein PC118_g9397 [Phytophthora cactorum]KAG3020755.1 hypothetical protein PC119_g9867 [Phytophthora cactorum]